MLIGYIQGMIDAVQTAKSAGALPAAFCVPPNTKSEKLRIAVCGYLLSRANGVDEDLDGTGVAGIAIGKAFPCSR